MKNDLLKELENDYVDLEPLFVMAYHTFIKSNEFSVTEKMIFLALKTYAGDKNSCYPAQSRLAGDLNLSRKSVNENLKSLEAKGAICIINKITESNRKTSNTYILARFDGHKGKFITESLEKYKALGDEPIIVKGF